jgi:hypothetical protein
MIQRALIAGVECGRVALESERCAAGLGPLPGDWHYLTTCLGRPPTIEEQHAFVDGWNRGMGGTGGGDGGPDTAH